MPQTVLALFRYLFHTKTGRLLLACSLGFSLCLALFGLAWYHERREIDAGTYREVMRAARTDKELRAAVDLIMRQEGQISNFAYQSKLRRLLENPRAAKGTSHVSPR